MFGEGRVIDRRTFLTAGAQATAVLCAVPLTGLGSEADPRLVAVQCLVFDAERPTCKSLATSIGPHLSSVYPLPSDVTGIWDSRVDLAIRCHEAIAGVTDQHTLFVFERVAWDAGKRVIYRTPFDDSTGQAIATTWLSGGVLPPPSVGAARASAKQDGDLVFWILASIETQSPPNRA